MRINIYAHLIIIEILDEIYARAQTWSSVEYTRVPLYSCPGLEWEELPHSITSPIFGFFEKFPD